MSRDLEALIDVIEAIELIFQYVEGVSPDLLATNIEKQDAILRRIAIIGEATKRLLPAFKEQHPDIPWKQIFLGNRFRVCVISLPIITMRLTSMKFGQ